MFQTCSSISNSIFVPSINVSTDKWKRIGSLIDPDFGNQLHAWADMHLLCRYWHCHIIPVLTLQLLGCPVKQLWHTFSHNSNGVVLFPHIDLQQTPLSKLKVLMDDYFYSLWGEHSSRHLCCYIFAEHTTSKSPWRHYTLPRYPLCSAVNQPRPVLWHWVMAIPANNLLLSYWNGWCWNDSDVCVSQEYLMWGCSWPFWVLSCLDQSFTCSKWPRKSRTTKITQSGLVKRSRKATSNSGSDNSNVEDQDRNDMIPDNYDAKLDVLQDGPVPDKNDFLIHHQMMVSLSRTIMIMVYRHQRYCQVDTTRHLLCPSLRRLLSWRKPLAKPPHLNRVQSMRSLLRSYLKYAVEDMPIRHQQE